MLLAGLQTGANKGFNRSHLGEEDSDLFVIAAVGNGIRASMAGALVGALHGVSWIPTRWYDNIENGQHGRDKIVRLARQLAATGLSPRPGGGR